MATISFNKKTPAPETQAVATLPKQEVARQFTSPQIEGEYTARDRLVPYLSLGQKSGTLCDEHPEWVGNWVWDKALCLGDTVRAVFCHLRKFYESDLDFDSDEIPQRYETAVEAKQDPAGFRDVCEIDMLIEVDKNPELEDFQVFTHGDKAYLPARYTVRKTAYGKTVRYILKDLGGWLKGDLSGGYYQIGTEKLVAKGNSYFAPKLKADGKVSPELRAKIEERFSA